MLGAAPGRGGAGAAVGVPVYNLSIPGSPTYYVGNHGVWVHNCNVSWTKARQLYWQAHGLKGPPKAEVWVIVRKTGQREKRTVSKELHHRDGRAGSNPHDPAGLQEVWPWEHEAADSFRHTGYDLERVIKIIIEPMD